MSSTPAPLSRAKAEAAFTLVKETLDGADTYGTSRAVLQDPGVQCGGWSVTLEETGIDFWPGWVLDRIGDDLQAAGVFAEPVTHCHLGLYPGACSHENETRGLCPVPVDHGADPAHHCNISHDEVHG